MRGRVSRKDKITVAAFRHMYMKRFATKWGETPAGKIDSIFDARIVPEKYLRGYHLDWLADHPEVIATWQETLLRSGKIRGSGGLAPSAVRNAAGYLSSMFDYAASVQMRRLTGVYANPVKD